MGRILVTGGTGQLGVPTVELLRKADHEVRVLSRSTGADLVTGVGVAEALAGVDTLVHLASTNNPTTDGEVTRGLFAAATKAGVSHIVMISIVGIDDIPLGYYRGRVEMEHALLDSRLPYTLLRATQFHSFVERLFTAQKLVPVIVAPGFSFQTIAVDEVATRLADLAGGTAQGRVADIGGPEQMTGREYAEEWKGAVHSRRAIISAKIPGKAMAGFAAGHNLVPGTPYGTGTFAEYLAGEVSTSATHGVG